MVKILSILGLILTLIGALIILWHAMTVKLIAGATPTDLPSLTSLWWFRGGALVLAVGFLVQLIAEWSK